MQINKQSFITTSALVTIFLFSLIMQSQLIQNVDVSWLLHATKMLLSGKHYYTDFIETNPPMILYLYSPSLILAKLLHCGDYLAFRIYMYSLIALGLLNCHILLKRCINKDDKWIRITLLLTLAVMLMIFPSYSFGEREHIAILFTMPYFLLATLRLKNQNVNKHLGIYIGLLAGLGFSLKPHFLFPLILIELYAILKQKNFFSWMRTETLTIAILLLSYLISIFLFNPNYIHKLLPLVYYLYIADYHLSWFLVIFNGLVGACITTLILYFILFQQIQYRTLATVLWLGCIGFLIGYLSAKLPWYYHITPAVTFATVLLMLFLTDCIKKLLTPRKNHSLQLSFIIVILFLLVFGVTFSFISFQQKTSLYQFRQPIGKAQIILKKYNNKRPIYFFTDEMLIPSYFTTYSHAQSASRFPADFFVAGLAERLEEKQNNPKQREITRKLKKELFDIVMADLKKTNPTLILIDTARNNLKLGPMKFNYLKFFSQDARFVKFMKHYRYAGKSDQLNLLIYVRKKS